MSHYLVQDRFVYTVLHCVQIKFDRGVPCHITLTGKGRQTERVGKEPPFLSLNRVYVLSSSGLGTQYQASPHSFQRSGGG